MTLAAGSRLGPYEILSPLGAGGMGEVSRAAVLCTVGGWSPRFGQGKNRRTDTDKKAASLWRVSVVCRLSPGFFWVRVRSIPPIAADP